MKYFYVHRNSGNAVFVKTEKFFIDQDGLKEKWGLGWRRIQAKSIEDARKRGAELLQPTDDALRAENGGILPMWRERQKICEESHVAGF